MISPPCIALRFLDTRRRACYHHRSWTNERRALMEQVIHLLAWSAWQPLYGCWRGTTIPALPGLYRIQRQGREDLDYIGQTGTGTMMLRNRLGMLRGIYGAQMPYRAPHT